MIAHLSGIESSSSNTMDFLGSNPTKMVYGDPSRGFGKSRNGDRVRKGRLLVPRPH